MVGYIITLVTIILVYISYILLYIFKPQYLAGVNKRYTTVNVVFLLITYTCYVGVVVIALVKNGLHDWNFQNTLPTANVSPFMFATLPVYFLLPKKVKVYYLHIIALLSVGMILSPVLGIAFNIYRHYSFHFSFLLDYVAHLSLSMWGVYILMTKQINFNSKRSLICIGFMGGVALMMLVLNLIFDTSFFGLNLRGKHNIYNVRIVENSFASCLIYFIGLFVIMIIGHFYLKLINKEKTH